MEKDIIVRNAAIVLAIIGIISLVSVEFISQTPFEQYVLVDKGPLKLNVDSEDYVNQSYVKHFTLKSGYKMNMEILNTYDTNYTDTVEVFFAIVPYSVYLGAIENDAAPTAALINNNRETFMENRYRYPLDAVVNIGNYPDIAGGDDDIDEGQAFFYTFMGDGSGSSVYSVPGKYSVIIWVTNDGGSTEKVPFGLDISVDGQGAMIRTILRWIGGIALGVAVLLGIAFIILRRQR